MYRPSLSRLVVGLLVIFSLLLPLASPWPLAGQAASVSAKPLDQRYTVFLPFIAQGLVDPAETTGEQPPPPRLANNSQHHGHGPVPPPGKSDTLFITDSGGELDMYLKRHQAPNGQITFPITIDRYFSTLITPDTVDAEGFLEAESQELLIERKLLPATATLLLSVFDVDHDAQDCPQQDLVSINGNALTGTRAFLTSGDAQWAIWRTDIPIGWLKFPTAAGTKDHPLIPAVNQISIDIDTRCQFLWAVEIDWGALIIHAPHRPIVFVHGWTGGTDSFRDFKQFADTDGIPSEPADLAKGIKLIADSAGLLHQEVDKISAMFGVDRVHLVAHSKGGVDARYALHDAAFANKVDSLVTLSSPHHGSDSPKSLTELQCRGVPKSECENAAEELSIDGMRIVNFTADCQKPFLSFRFENCVAQFRQAEGVNYSTLGGGVFLNQLFDVDRNSNTYPWRSDAWLNDQQPYPHTATLDGVFSYTHTDINRQREVYECVLSLLGLPLYGPPAATCPGGNHPTAPAPSNVSAQNQRDATLATNGAVLLPLSALRGLPTLLHQTAELSAQSSLTVPLALDGGRWNVLSVVSSVPVTVTLVDPAGTTITPDRAARDPTLTYTTQLDPDFGSGPLYQYQIAPAPAGMWHIVVQSHDPATVLVQAVSDSPVQLQYRSPRLVYRPGDMATIEAALVNGTTRLSGVHIRGWVTQPDGTTTPIVLGDESSNGDNTPGDHIHTAQFNVAHARGYIQINLIASDGVITRTTTAQLAVGAQTARFQGVVAEAAEDRNGNRLYDTLALTVALSTTVSGHVEVAGTLVDPTGHPVATSRVSTRMAGMAPLAAGTPTMVLPFRGETIRASGRDGPFMLTDVRIYDTNSILLETDRATHVYTTTTYVARQFEGPLFTPVSITEHTPDTNANGRYEHLDIRVVLDVALPGTYHWTGRLMDQQDNEMGWFTGSGRLDAHHPLTFRFSATAIKGHRANGPYHLRDVAIHSTDGGAATAYFDRLHTTAAYAADHFDAPSMCDPYEPDGLAHHARHINLGETQRHQICVSSDRDWVTFRGHAGTAYRLEALNAPAHAHLSIRLYAGDARTLLDSSDGTALDYLATTDDTYYVLVTSEQPNSAYDLRLTTTPCPSDSYEPDNLPSAAQPFPLGTSQSRALCFKRDADWVTFTGQAGMHYVIETLHTAVSADTYLELYASDGRTLLLADDNSGGGRAARIDTTLSTSGTFYVQVRHQRPTAGDPSLTYSLRISAAPPSACASSSHEPNNTPAQARLFPVGQSQTHALCATGDADWIVFAAVANTTYTIETVNLAAATDTYMEVYTDQGLNLVSTDQSPFSSASSLQFTARSATDYYVKVRTAEHTSGDPTQTYTLRIAASQCSDRHEPNNTVAQATPFPVGTTQSHGFCVPGDSDWVRFTATAGTNYRLETLNLAVSNDTLLELYASNGTTLVQSNDNGGINRASRIEFVPTASGTYYVRVRHPNAFRGDPAHTYDLRIRAADPAACHDPAEPDTSVAHAQLIDVGRTQSRAFCAPSDADWLAFAATAGTRYRLETVNLGPYTDTYLEVYASDGSTLIAADDNGSSSRASRVEVTPSTTGILYVRLRQSNGGGFPDYTYDFQISIPTQVCNDSYEPDDTRSEAQLFTIGEIQTRAFCVPGDQDWVAFVAEAGVTYRIETLHLPPETVLILDLYTPDGSTWLDGSFGEWGRDAVIEFTPATSGTYLLNLYHANHDGDPAFTYDLRITLNS